MKMYIKLSDITQRNWKFENLNFPWLHIPLEFFLLHFTAKLFENGVYTSYLHFLISKPLLTPLQSGFCLMSHSKQLSFRTSLSLKSVIIFHLP